MPTPSTLYLIDGYAQFFRAYHAIRTPMTSPVTKEPTNMSFGFLGMLLKLLRGEGKVGADGARPDYIAVALDVSGDRGTFRSTIYPQYKANRPPPPDDLLPQVDRCLEAMRAMGVPIIGSEGFEADDCIATLVTRLRAEHPNLRVRIISKDKDLKQLLRHEGTEAPSHEGRERSSAAAVELYDIHTDVVIDEAALKAETGITPAQVIDMLTLMGDTVDNVPGVEGVGPKTAAKLVAEHGSLDAVLAAAAAGKIKGKLGERLNAMPRKDLELSRELVTLRHNVPVELDLAAADTRKLNLAALGPVLKELGFNRYQEELRALIGGTPRERVDRPPSAAPANNPPPKGTSRVPEVTGGLFDQLPAESASRIAGLIQPQSGQYRAITKRAQLDELVKELRAAEIISIDTETTGLSPLRCKLCGICLATQRGSGVYVPIRSPDAASHLDEKTVLDALRPILEDPAKAKCGHNLKYDMLVLRNHGVRMAGVCVPMSDVGCRMSDVAAGAKVEFRTSSTAFDSMIGSFLIDASRSSHGLDALALALLARTNISIKDLIGGGGGRGEAQRTFDTVGLDQATLYAAEDADVALQLRENMLPQLRAMGLMPLFEHVEMPLVDVLAELEFNGIRVDRAELDRQRARLQGRIDELKKQIDAAAMEAIGRTFNPDSPKQLAAALFNKPSHEEEPGLGLKPIKKIKTGYSTDAEVLEKLAQDAAITTPIPGLIVEHRELTKLVNTYLVSLVEEINPDTGRIHSSFSQTVAVTGRLASSDPNLQNIPIRTDVGREIRRAFIADPGNVLVSADYSQIELRLLAHLSRDPALIQAFHEGQDIHTAVAAQIHGIPLDKVTKQQRNGAKMVNFGIVYGITAFGLARRLGIGNDEAGRIITDYKRRFAGITTFLQECIDHAQRTGYVQTMLGRRRPIPDIHSNNPSRRALAERTAINSVVQGSAADLIKIAMVNIHAALRSHATANVRNDVGLGGVRMLLQIHDELVFECPAAVAADARDFIVSRMEGAMTLSVPLKVDASIATNWFDGK